MVPSPSCPTVLSPQHHTSPSLVVAQPVMLPIDTDTAFDTPATATGASVGLCTMEPLPSSPSSPCPQQRTPPSATAQAVASPTGRVVQSARCEILAPAPHLSGGYGTSRAPAGGDGGHVAQSRHGDRDRGLVRKWRSAVVRRRSAPIDRSVSQHPKGAVTPAENVPALGQRAREVVAARDARDVAHALDFRRRHPVVAGRVVSELAAQVGSPAIDVARRRNRADVILIPGGRGAECCRWRYVSPLDGRRMRGAVVECDHIVRSGALSTTPASSQSRTCSRFPSRPPSRVSRRMCRSRCPTRHPLRHRRARSRLHNPLPRPP